MVELHHNKGIDMVKLESTLPNLANICLHSSIKAKFYQFTESDKNLLSKVPEDMAGGPSKVFPPKTVVDKTDIRNSTNVCKSIVGIDASQLYPYSMFQPLPRGLYTRYKFDGNLQRFKPCQNISRSFENMVMSYFQRMRPDCRIESFYTTGTQTVIDRFKDDGICAHCNTVFEATGCFYHYYRCQGAGSALTEKDIQRGSKKGNPMNCGDSISSRKVKRLAKRSIVNGGNPTKLTCQ